MSYSTLPPVDRIATALAGRGFPHWLIVEEARRLLESYRNRIRAGQIVDGTNAEAEDYRIVTAPLADPSRANWTELVPHRPGVLILSINLLADWLVRLERENALPRIVIRHLASGEEHSIAFDEEAYSLGVIPGYEFETDTLRFAYSSMATPNEVWDYDMA